MNFSVVVREGLTTGRTQVGLCSIMMCHIYHCPGAATMLERVSPQVVVLNPPEKLVIETLASGEYRQIYYSRNGNLFSPFPSAPFFVRVPDEFSNFHEIFVREPTTTNDLGVYEVELQLNFGQPQVSIIEFIVTPYSKPVANQMTHLLCALG